MTDVSPTHEWPRPRQHVSFNLPVVATGAAGAFQLAAGEASRNYAIVTDRTTQIAVAVLFIVAAALVIAGWALNNRSACPMRQDMGLRIKACGLAGWSVGMVSYVVANWQLWPNPAQFFSSPATMVIAAMIPPTLHRAWVLLRPVRPIV